MPRVANGRRSARRMRRNRNRPNGTGLDQSGWGLQLRVPDSHKFVRRDIVPIDPGSAGVSQGLALTFALDQLPNYTDFTNLFDSYAIERVDVVMIPGVNPIQIYSCPDYDDSVAPTGLADMLERQGTQVQVVGPSSFQQFRKSIVPRMPIEGASGAGPQLAPVGMKIDCSDASVVHHGYKFWIAPANTTTSTPFMGWQIVCTYHLKFWAAK